MPLFHVFAGIAFPAGDKVHIPPGGQGKVVARDGGGADKADVAQVSNLHVIQCV